MLSQSLGLLAAIAPSFVVSVSAASPRVIPRADYPFTYGALLKWWPDCSVDPSLNTYQSEYSDGEGQYVTSSCDNGLWQPAVVSQHCWTDMFVVRSQIIYEDWQNSGEAIDCATTSICSEEITVETKPTCVTDNTTWDVYLGTKLQAQIPRWFNQDGNGVGSLTYDHSSGKDIHICTSVSGQGTCTWDDQSCHQLWTSNRNIRIMGYLRRSCNSPKSDTNVANSEQRADGYYTTGLQDFDFQIPNNRVVGCSAKCGDTSYSEPTPDPEGLVDIPAT